MNGNGGKTGDLTRLGVPEQLLQLNVSGKTYENSVVRILFVAILREKTTAADGSGCTVGQQENISGGGGFAQNGRMKIVCFPDMRAPLLLVSR